MSQWARNNPERCEAGEDRLDAHSDLSDMRDKLLGATPCPKCKGRGTWEKETFIGTLELGCDHCAGTGEV